MNTCSLSLFHALLGGKHTKYITYEQAYIFLTTDYQRLAFDRAFKTIHSEIMARVLEMPPSFSINPVEERPNFELMFGYSATQPGALKVVEDLTKAYEDTMKTGDDSKKLPDLPWFARKIPHELRCGTKNIPREIQAIIQVFCLKYEYLRVYAVVEGKGKLEPEEEKEEEGAEIQASLTALTTALTSKSGQAISTTFLQGLTAILKNKLRFGSHKTHLTSGTIPAPLSDEECLCCAEVVTGKSYLLDCNHTFCFSCVAKMTNLAVEHESRWPPRCCNINIPKALILAALNEHERKRFSEAVLEFGTAREDRWYCKHPKCRKFFKPTSKYTHMVSCTHCGYEMCSSCRRQRHRRGTPCDDDDQTAALKALAWRACWQTCPHCSQIVERIDGCSEMKCRCGRVFCYDCGRSTCEGCDFWVRSASEDRMRDYPEVKLEARKLRDQRQLYVGNLFWPQMPDDMDARARGEAGVLVALIADDARMVDKREKFVSLMKQLHSLSHTQQQHIRERHRIALHEARARRKESEWQQEIQICELKERILETRYKHIVEQEDIQDLMEEGLLGRQKGELMLKDLDREYAQKRAALNQLLKEKFDMTSAIWKKTRKEELRRAILLEEYAKENAEADMKWATFALEKCNKMLKFVEALEFRALAKTIAQKHEITGLKL